MSSVQSFLKQRTVGTTLYGAGTASSLTLYRFIAGAAATGTSATAVSAQGNYVGNYPPGFFVAAGALNTQGGQTFTNPVLRDMGKTIKASLATGPDGNTLGSAGFWREVQILDPSVVSGPTVSTNNGVTGSAPGLIPASNTGDDGYNTYYIPIVVGGVSPGNPTTGAAVVTATAAGLAIIPGNIL